ALKLFGRPDARQHQKLWRIDCRGRDDDFASCLDDLNPFAGVDLDPDGTLILDDHTPREAIDEPHILAPERGPEIGVGGRPAAAEMDRLLHRPEAFLLGAIVVVRKLEPSLSARLDEGGVERIAARATLHVQWPLGAAPA